jgi:hypothetical protein
MDAESEEKHPQVHVTLRVVEGPAAGNSEDWYGSFHPNAAKYTLEALRALGWTGTDVTDLTGIGSTKVIAIEKESEYKGKVRRRIEGIWPIKKREMDAKKKKSFAASFKALAAGLPACDVNDDNKAPETLPEAPDASAFPESGVDEDSTNPFA